MQKLLGYGFIPNSSTFLDGFQKVLPGHMIEYGVKDAQIKHSQFWSFPKLSAVPGIKKTDEVVDTLEEKLRVAIRRKTMSDVPLGALLSGGIDSSLIMALSDVRLDSFTVGFQEDSFDESPYARMVADTYSNNHTEVVLHQNRCKELIPDVLGKVDDPIADPSIIPTFLANQISATGVKVLLTGDGGDELFAGYETFKGLPKVNFLENRVPKFLRSILKSALDITKPSSRNMSFDYKARRVLNGMDYAQPYWNAVWLAPASSQQIKRLLGFECDVDSLYSEAEDLWDESLSLEDNTQKFYFEHYLKHNIMAKSDRASMLNSIEGRSVFLDNDLVDFAFTLPYSVKCSQGITKRPLRELAKRYLPDKIVQRPKKGFGMPIYSWIKEMPNEWFTSSLVPWDTDYLTHLLNEHRSGKRDHRLLLWTVLALNFSINKYR